MKRLLLPIVLMLMLCACESAAPPVRESVAEFWQRTGSVSAEVAVRAEFDDYAVDFRMDCAYSDGRCSVTVTEPAEIGGVEILVEENGLTVEYAGSSIEAGEGGIEVIPVRTLQEALELLRAPAAAHLPAAIPPAVLSACPAKNA